MPHDQVIDFTSAIWHCGYDGKLISFEGDVAFDSVLGTAHRRQGLHLHDVFLLCLKRPSARMAINEFDMVLSTRDQSAITARKMQDIVLIDGTFARQNIIMRPQGGLSVIWTEISDIRSETVKYRRQANHDPLTGLLNRRGFELGIGGHYKGRRPGKYATLLQIDLDNFKNVNDQYGHDSGDRVLIHTAECLRQVFGFGSLIARTGGDEFAVLHLQRDPGFDVSCAAKRLNCLICDNEFAPAEATGLGVSVGAVQLEDQTNFSVQEMLSQADRELYASKKLGKAKAQLKNGPTAFEFEFQPIVTLPGRDILGFEALLRHKIRQPQQDDIGRTLKALQESRTLAGIERGLFPSVIEAYKTLVAQTGRAFEFSVNLCQQQWEDETLVPWLRDTLRAAEVPFDKFRIELLEDIRIGEPLGQVHRNLIALSDLGLAVDLDDFGLSGASLDRLTLPCIGRVKVARHMVKRYWDDLRVRRIVDSILSLSKSFGYPVIVEGIEEEWQVETFEKSNCTLAQGFLFSRSQPLSHWLTCPEIARPFERDTVAALSQVREA
ncbi:MAG: EAL domain-containing protein [Pseudomonadota bacterium]